MLFRRLFSSANPVPRGAEGWRAYAVGDVHGCIDLLDGLLHAIQLDHRSRPDARGLLIFLGDLIDRGPASAQVLDRVRSLELPGFRVVALAGNHEEVLLRILDGDLDQIAPWLKFGGAEALASYGLDPEEIDRMDPEQARSLIAATIPEDHTRLLSELGDSFRFGDYLFVHAGIRPGVPLAEQTLADLRWIREPFLSDRRDHGFTVVHGHTISDEVEAVGCRIGIDTGAYWTGRLTALGIDGRSRWLIDTIDGLRGIEKRDV